jgi:hypothetical protein
MKDYIECSIEYCGRKVVARFDKKLLLEEYNEQKVIHEMQGKKLGSLKTAIQMKMLGLISEMILKNQTYQLLKFG